MLAPCSLPASTSPTLSPRAASAAGAMSATGRSLVADCGLRGPEGRGEASGEVSSPFFFFPVWACVLVGEVAWDSTVEDPHPILATGAKSRFPGRHPAGFNHPPCYSSSSSSETRGSGRKVEIGSNQAHFPAPSSLDEGSQNPSKIPEKNRQPPNPNKAVLAFWGGVLAPTLLRCARLIRLLLTPVAICICADCCCSALVRSFPQLGPLN